MFAEKTELNLMTTDRNEGALVELSPAALDDVAGGIVWAAIPLGWKLAGAAVRAYGDDIQVQPGMLLTAGIVIDRRTLVEWLLDPIYAVGRLG